MKDKISIIVPVYNVEQYLDKCLDSICNQTYKNLEIILVDDGSTDSSGIICDKWKEKDKRIIVVHQKNSGVSSARNKGLEICTGEYIGFVDSDDYISIDMYEKMIGKLKKTNAEVCICNFMYLKNDQMIFQKNNIKKSTLDKFNYCNNMILENNIYGYLWNRLYKKEIMSKYKFDEKVKVLEDLLFNIQLLKNITKVYYLNEPLYIYRIRENSAVRQRINNETYLVLYAHLKIIDELSPKQLTICREHQQIIFLLESKKLEIFYEIKNIEINDPLYNDILKARNKYYKVLFKPSLKHLILKIKCLLIYTFPSFYKFSKIKWSNK